MSQIDEIFKDNDAHLLRLMAKRITALERLIRDLSPPGGIVEFVGSLRSSTWSNTRKESVGGNYSCWWQMNEVNLERVLHDQDEVDSRTLALPAEIEMGQPGLMTSEGSYSIRNTGGTGVFISDADAGVATPDRGWSIEAIFSPTILPQQAYICFNGLGTDGYGIYISNAAGSGSGSLLTFLGSGMTPISTGVTLAVNNRYHIIGVADDVDNTLKWYLGTYDPLTGTFLFQDGSVAMPTPPVAPTGHMYAAQFAGYLDDFLFYDSKISGAVAKQSAQDRIRAALEPGPPSGWLTADGAAVSRNKYSQLFRVSGTQHGAGDGVNTFNLPDVPGSIIKV